MADGSISYTYYKNEAPERCVSDYAKNNPEDDICESIVAFLLNPEVLDKERLNFLKNQLLRKETKPEEVSLIKRGPNKIDLPKIGSRIKYKVKRKKPLFRKITH